MDHKVAILSKDIDLDTLHKGNMSISSRAVAEVSSKDYWLRARVAAVWIFCFRLFYGLGNHRRRRKQGGRELSGERMGLQSGR